MIFERKKEKERRKKEGKKEGAVASSRNDIVMRNERDIGANIQSEDSGRRQARVGTEERPLSMPRLCEN